MQSNTSLHAIVAAITGTLVGICNTITAASALQSVLLTAVSSAVGCIVSYCMQQLIKKLK